MSDRAGSSPVARTMRKSLRLAADSALVAVLLRNLQRRDFRMDPSLGRGQCARRVAPPQLGLRRDFRMGPSLGRGQCARLALLQ